MLKGLDHELYCHSAAMTSSRTSEALEKVRYHWSLEDFGDSLSSLKSPSTRHSFQLNLIVHISSEGRNHRFCLSVIFRDGYVFVAFSSSWTLQQECNTRVTYTLWHLLSVLYWGTAFLNPLFDIQPRLLPSADRPHLGLSSEDNWNLWGSLIATLTTKRR